MGERKEGYRAPTVEIDGNKVVLSISVSEGRQESTIANVGDVIPLINAILQYEGHLEALDEIVRTARMPGIAAQHMIYQCRLLEAISAACLLVDITTGQADIADHGFPEFGISLSYDV